VRNEILSIQHVFLMVSTHFPQSELVRLGYNKDIEEFFIKGGENVLKAIRNMIGFLLILIIVAGVGYIGWYSSGGDFKWGTHTGSGTETGTSAHSQHSTGQQPEPASPAQVNPMEELQQKVASAHANVKQMSDWVQAQSDYKGIYLMSESVYLLNQLNQALANQTGLSGSADPTYDTYVNRYNVLSQSQTTLGSVYAKLTEAKEIFLKSLAGTTDEAGPAEDVQQTNKGIYQMAQTIMEFESTNQWIDNQIKLTVTQADALSAMQAAAAVSESPTTASPSISGIQLPGLMTMITVLFVILLGVGLIGMIRSLVIVKSPQVEQSEQNI
jgi:flagellar basal body-associated protein FliL